jgi:Domain of unknown function (DUF4190)/Domain of unknown function (DUF1707)
VTPDPGPGSNGFPLPPSTTPPPGGLPAYGPPTYGPVPYGPQQQSGYGQGPYGGQSRYAQPGMLCAQADRDRTMDVLKSAYTEGRLNKTEFDERSVRVLSARTYGDLHALVADLPTGPGGPNLPAPYPGPGYYSPQLAQRTNGFAVGALVCGIVPFFGGIPAVILGHVARGQIKQSGERGDGVAIAGLVLGYLWITLWVLVILVGIAKG